MEIEKQKIKATMGDIVTYILKDEDEEMASNGVTELPAIVVHVNDGHAVNLRIFGDSEEIFWRTSVPHVEELYRQKGSWRFK